MASCFVPKLAIEGIQTVTPMKITDPRQTRQVLAGDVVGPGIFQRCLNIVHYYMKDKEEEDSGWLVAGWIKETLGRALMEQPMICGRLRRVEGNDVGELEVVSNDCGIRLIEASIQINLSEFLDHLKQREEAETQLVFWKDIDEHNPQFSPLFYVQVTNFQCGGYSIGISCSILVADLLLRTEFLKTWAKIHNNIVNNNNERKLPLFYLPGLKSTTGLAAAPNMIISSTTSSKNSGKTVIFKMNMNNNAEISSTDQWFRKLALHCVEEAENNLVHDEKKMGSEFALFVNESFEAIKVERCSKSKHENEDEDEDGVLKRVDELGPHINELGRAKWDDLGANDVTFRQGNKPARVSYWFTSSLGGFVIVIPSMEEEEEEDACKVNIIVTIPN